MKNIYMPPTYESIPLVAEDCLLTGSITEDANNPPVVNDGEELGAPRMYFFFDETAAEGDDSLSLD